MENNTQIKINLPKDVSYIISQLKTAGFEAYAVGGCVRDAVLGKEPHDWDLCTNAGTEDIKSVFKNQKQLLTGEAYGTISIGMSHSDNENSNEFYEITTFRKDGTYDDGRHPDKITAASSIEEDLSRRDFTVNAMAYNPDKGIIDPFNGMGDINNKIIKCVGDPNKRFKEDSLRVMRAMRFASTLNFSVERNTKAAMLASYKSLDYVSWERKGKEFFKMMGGDGAYQMIKDFTPVITHLIPELKESIHFAQNNPYHDKDVWEHVLETVKHSPNDAYTKTALLLHDVAKPQCYKEDENLIGHFHGHPSISASMTDEILQRMKFTRADKEQIVDLVKYHDLHFEDTDAFAKRWINKLGQEQFMRLIDIRMCDIKGQAPYTIEERLIVPDKVKIIAKKVIEDIENNKDVCLSVKDLAISGKDLIAEGMKPGKEMGETLDYLLNEVIEDKVENDKEKLIDVFRKRKEKINTMENAVESLMKNVSDIQEQYLKSNEKA